MMMMMSRARGMASKRVLLSGINQSHGAQRMMMMNSVRRVPGTSIRGMATFDFEEDLTPVTMPALSPTMESGNLASWEKSEGEEVGAGEILAQVETDKAVVDYEMQDDAVLAKIIVPAGTQDLKIGDLLAFTVEDMDAYNDLMAAGGVPENMLSGDASAVEATPAAAVEAAPAAAQATPEATITREEGGYQPRIKFLGKRSLLKHEPVPAAAPVVEAPVASVSSTTPSQSQVLSAVDEGEYTDIPNSNIRKVVASRMVESKNSTPHAYSSIDVELDNIMAMRKRIKAKGVKTSVNDFLLKAIAMALRDVPECNRQWDTKLNAPSAVSDQVDISVAVATDKGLMVPIVPNVDTKGLSAINSKFGELVVKARNNKLSPDEMTGGSFTMSSLGNLGIDKFTSIINMPQSCIMAVGSGKKIVSPPANGQGEPVIKNVMSVQLSSDRRIVDEAVAGQFLSAFQSYMNDPELLML